MWNTFEALKVGDFGEVEKKSFYIGSAGKGHDRLFETRQ